MSIYVRGELSLTCREILSCARRAGKMGFTHDSGWRSLFSGLDKYERTFKGVIGALRLGSINEIFDYMNRVAGAEILTLDLCGYGQILRDLRVDRGLAVALSDKRTPEMQKADTGKINLIEGNILLRSTWRKIDRYLNPHASATGNRFGLIFCCPLGAFSRGPLGQPTMSSTYHFPTDRYVLFSLLGRLYVRLSHTYGVLLTQATTSLSSHELNSLVQALNQLPGVVAAYNVPSHHMVHNYHEDYWTLIIIKGPDAPDNLRMLRFASDSATVTRRLGA